MKAIEQNIEKEIAQAVMEEQPMQPPAPKRKKRLTESTAAKVIAFLLMLVMTAVTAGGVLGAVFLYSTDVYVTSETAFKQELFSNIAWGDGQTLLNFLIWNSEEQVYQMNTEAADSYCAERNISYVMVQDKTGRELWYTGLAEYDSPWQFRFSYDWANPERPSAGVVENAYTVRITVPLSSVFVYDDDYALANRLAELAYALRYWIYAIIAAAALLVTVCFIFLLCAAGHHPYVDGVRPGWGTRIPLDLLTAAVALGLFLGIQLVVEANFGGIGVVLAVVLGPAALAGVFTGWGSNWVAGGGIQWSMWPSACSAVAAGRSFGPWAAASGAQRMGWRDCFTTSPWWARPCWCSWASVSWRALGSCSACSPGAGACWRSCGSLRSSCCSWRCWLWPSCAGSCCWAAGLWPPGT